MEILLDHFPVFEANQVLTSGHLNDVFDYLDQQERQTRSHLIGIGIVCGLEIGLTGSTIAISKGCGVTSEGYLIVEPDDLSLLSYRTYTLPPDIDYPQFKDGTNQYALWELFEAGTPTTTLLSSPANFLDDKVVVLFLELKKEGLRNCSPNNCDDKGSQVTATVRRLLIAKSDADMIIAAANGLGSGLTASDIDGLLSARLNLPDLKLRRFDVTSSNPVTSNDVYAAFLNMVRTGGLASATGNALKAAFDAFKPLLAKNYATNPFANFVATYGFLDNAPANVKQVGFLQYYADLFDDLLRAYDEFRWKGLELICACCPDDGLFPRHLMLGLLHPEIAAKPTDYRQKFLASPATGDCAKETKEVVQLFARLVEMAVRFTNTPSLPKPNPSLPIDPQIRATPSTVGCGCDELAAKAIPYYYAEDGNPPLYRLWSPVRTARNRANQNLSYNSDLYTNPTAPAFVTDPLRFDLEPYNFLRIEGHLGKSYLDVLRSLLTMKAQYRLPVDVIALRTGVYDDTQPVDLAKEAARFQDLEAIYEALRGDLMAAVTEGVMQLYDHAIAPIPTLNLAAGAPKLQLLTQYAPHYSYSANTIGAWYENYLNRFEAQGYIDIDQNDFTNVSLLLVYCVLFNGTKPPDADAYPHVVAIYYMAKLSEILPPTLGQLDYADFENKYQDLMALIRYLRSDAVNQVTPDLKNFLPKEEFVDFCEGILFSCKLDAIKATNDDYVARVSELRKMQFLSSFLQQHPGIQHKAGVPMGGTFILVYHGQSQPTGNVKFNFNVMSQLAQASELKFAEAAPMERAAGAPMETEKSARVTETLSVAQKNAAQANAQEALVKAIGNISANRALIENDDVGTLIGMLTGVIGFGGSSQNHPPPGDPAAKIIAGAVGNLSDGIVIADFFLPYQISCDCPGVQFVLPKFPPTFELTAGCTGADGNAAVAVDAKGGVPPYDVAVDGGAFAALASPITLAAGDHTVKLRDAGGTESAPQPIKIAPQLTIDPPKFDCQNGQYTASAPVKGGTPPYTVDGKPVDNSTISAGPLASGTSLTVTVTDSKGCTATVDLGHTCPPSFTLAVSCTAANGKAPVTITATNGVAPYSVSVDGGAYSALVSPLQLATGAHTIKLRDSQNTDAQSQNVTVAPPIVIDMANAKYSCADGKYTGSATFTGGTPPWTVNGKPVAAPAIVTDPTPSGTALTMTVMDSKGCTASADFNHTCCTLPCDGITLNRGYRMFIPDANKASPYKSFNVRAVTFKVTASPGNDIDLSKDVAAIVTATATQLSPTNFETTVNTWIKNINQLIAKTGGLFEDGKAQWLTVGYQAVGPGQLGILTIEYFKCLGFDIRLDVTYTTSTGEKNPKVRYTPPNTTIVSGDITSTIPAFDGTTTDKCNDTKPVPLCPTKPDFTVSATAKPDPGVAGRPIAFTPTASVPLSGLTYFWEAPDGSPDTGQGQTFQTTFGTGGSKAVTVTGFNAKGCSATASISVKVEAAG
jgi:hypothetical protein